MYSNFIKKINNPLKKNKYSLGDLLVKTSIENGTYKERNLDKRTNDKAPKTVIPNNNESISPYELLNSSILKQFKFIKNELMIIAYLYTLYINEERTISAMGLLKKIFGDNSNSLVNSHLLTKLAQDGIIIVINMSTPSYTYATGDLFNFNNLDDELLFGYNIYLSKQFLNYIIDEQPPILIEDGYISNSEFLQDVFHCCQLAFRYTNVPDDQWRIDLYDLRLNQKYNNIRERLNNTSIEIPFKSLEEKHQLIKHEQLTIWHLLDREKNRFKAEVGMLTKLIEDNIYSRNNINSVLSENGKLLKNNLISLSKGMTRQGTTTNISIEPEIYSLLVNNPKHKNLTSTNLIESNPAVQLSTPIKSLENLILSDNENSIITSLIKSSSTKTYKILEEWGFYDSISSQEQTIILLHGLPGIGKTLSAEVIATELHKELMTVDISQIKNKWIGESEKNLRNVFNTYDEYYQKYDNPPILLLNECDQILSKRTENISQFSDQMMNTMQNMLLEFLENFKGICIATTNLASNLDSAFSRRFTHKIELSWPKYNERVKLWGLFIPNKLPLASCVDIKDLAEKYSFSGSQIKTVILNTATEAASINENDQQITQDNFIKFAEMEKIGSFDNSSINDIGFTG